MKRYDVDRDGCMDPEIDGLWVKYEDVEKLIADAIQERDEWQKAYGSQQQVTQDIGRTLCAKVPYELINEVARRRMQELADAIRERDHYKAACEMATALRPLGTVQVVEGGGAVLLDTGRK